jgi:hypothetical protein
MCKQYWKQFCFGKKRGEKERNISCYFSAQVDDVPFASFEYLLFRRHKFVESPFWFDEGSSLTTALAFPQSDHPIHKSIVLSLVNSVQRSKGLKLDQKL